MPSLTSPELLFACFLIALIAAAPWVPRLGEALGSLLGKEGRGVAKPR